MAFIIQLIMLITKFFRISDFFLKINDSAFENPTKTFEYFLKIFFLIRFFPTRLNDAKERKNIKKSEIKTILKASLVLRNINKPEIERRSKVIKPIILSTTKTALLSPTFTLSFFKKYINENWPIFPGVKKLRNQLIV